MRLTDLSIRKLLLLPSGQKIQYDDGLPGFGVRISQKSKAFIVTYGKDRKRKTLGKFPDMSLSDARKAAKRILAHQTPYNTSFSYSDASEDFLEASKLKNRSTTYGEYKRYLNAYETSKKLEDISRRDIQEHLKMYSDMPSSYAHALTAFKVFFNWAIRHEMCEKHPLAGERAVMPKARERVLTTDEIKEIWNYEFTPFSNILKLLIVTGQRRGEIASLHSNWINEDVIIFPEDVMKNKKSHTLPVGELTKQFLKGEGLLFGNTKGTSFSGWSKAKIRIDKNVKIPDWTIHDIRRTFSTIHAELGTPVHVTEKLLAHSSGTISGVAAVYNRHTYLKEMRDAVAKYEKFISKLIAI